MARILVADDDVDIRELVEFKLSTLGHDVVAVSDGAAAIDACQARGKILVRLRAVSTPFVGVELVVEDEGPGVPVAIRDRIFEPFFTTKTRGTGLGMAISKRIVEAHGGTIELAPEGDRGAVFVIRLPKGRVSLEPKFR